MLGALITIAEPDLQLLAQQVPSIPNRALILSVAAGVGLFLAVVAAAHRCSPIKLSHALLFFYALTFLLALSRAGRLHSRVVRLRRRDDRARSRVPFIMAMGIGMSPACAATSIPRSDSFGLIALCSIGSVLAVLLLGVFYSPGGGGYLRPCASRRSRSTQAAAAMLVHLGAARIRQRGGAWRCCPIAGDVSALFQLISPALPRRVRSRRICRGPCCTPTSGLVLFLTGVNEGFLAAGWLLGNSPSPAADIAVSC